MKIKICGLNPTRDVQTCIDLNVHLLGFVFFKKSPRNTNPRDIDILKKYLNGCCNLISTNSSSINVGDDFRLPSFNNEKGIVRRISNNNIWIYLKSIGYSVKLKLA